MDFFSFLTPFWSAILAAIGVALLGVLRANAKRLLSVNKLLETIAAKDEKRSKQIETLSIVSICNMRGSRAILEVVAQQKCNGNVEEAFSQFELGEQKIDEFTRQESWV